MAKPFFMLTALKAGTQWRAGRRSRRYQGPVTAMEVDGLTLRVVSATGRGTVTRVAARPLDLASEAERADVAKLGPAIARALDRLRLKPGPVVMGVPRASVLLRTLSLPVIEAVEEVAAMVHLQVGKDLPFRTDEAVIDFQMRPPTSEDRSRATARERSAGAEGSALKMEVLVAVVKRDVVDFYQKVAAAAGLKLVALGLLPYGNARCVEACRVAEDGGGVALITLRPDEVGIDLVAEGSLQFSRGASIKAPADLIGTGPASTAAATVEPALGAWFAEAVTIEVVRSLHSFGGLETQRPMSKVVVAGATGQEAAVVEALQGRLSVPCGALNAAQALDLPSDESDAASGSISALGLALGTGDEGGLAFDFLNPKKPAAPRDLRRLRLLLGVGAALAVLVFVFGLRSYLISQRLKLKERVGQELLAAKKKRAVYFQMRQQLATVQGWTQGAQNWLEHYAYLSAVLPSCEEVYVTSFSISGSGAIRFSVQARSGQVLAKLDKQLRAAGYEVKPLAITPGEEKLGYGFRSTVELEVPSKMKIDLTKVRPPPRPADDASLDGGRKGGGS